MTNFYEKGQNCITYSLEAKNNTSRILEETFVIKVEKVSKVGRLLVGRPTTDRIMINGRSTPIRAPLKSTSVLHRIGWQMVLVRCLIIRIIVGFIVRISIVIFDIRRFQLCPTTTSHFLYTIFNTICK